MVNIKVKTAILSLLLFIISINLKGQRVNNIFNNYSPADVLPAYNISKVIQDQYGFIWMTSQQGLHCFDGKTIFTITFDYDNPSLFLQTHIRDIYLDGDSLWVAISYGGISIVDVRKRKVVGSINCKVDPSAPCDFSNWTLTIGKSKNDEMWFGTYEGIYTFSKKTKNLSAIHLNPFNNKKEDFTAHFISIDTKNRVWVNIDDFGIAVYDGYNKKLITTLNKDDWKFKSNEETIIKKIVPDKDHGMLIATNKGVLAIDAEKGFEVSYIKFESDITTGKVIPQSINGIRRLKNGNYWFATLDGCFKTDSNFVLTEMYSSANSNLLDDIIFDIFEDKDGYIWMPGYKGLSLLNPNKEAFTNYFYNSKAMKDKGQFLKTLPVSDSLLITAAFNGLYLLNLNDGELKQVNNNKRNENDEFFAIEKLPDGNILTSSKNKLYIVAPYQRSFKLLDASDIYPELQSISREVFISIFPINDSIVLFGSQYESGFFLWNMHSKKIKNYSRISGNKNTPMDNNTNHISKDKDGYVWIQSDMALMRLDWQKGIFKNYFPNDPAMPFNSTILYDLYDDGSYYWIATYGGGISRVNKKSKAVNYITVNEGLCNNCVFSITPKNDYLWVTTNHGVSRINQKTLEIKNYYAENGLHDNSLDERSASSSGSLLFFSGINGITRVDTRLLKTKSPKPLTYITNISYYLNDSIVNIPGLNPDYLKLPSNTSSIRITLSSISFPDGGLTRFAYRIPQISNNWVQIEKTNIISLAGLYNGKYNLQIKSYNSDGQESEETISMIIEIQPAWYQTNLFKIIILFLCLGVSYGFYRFRILQFMRIEKIRRNIAGNLHDDIGSTLSSINIYAGLAKKETNKNSHLDAITSNISEVVTKLDDLVWSINPRYDSILSIINRLHSYAEPICLAKGIKFQTEVNPQETDLKLSAEVKHNIYLIAKELVNNSIKHSGCSNIQAQFVFQHKTMIMSISDNGTGFDENSIRKDRHGLSNISQRVANIKGSLSTVSNKGAGTKTSISVPV